MKICCYTRVSTQHQVDKDSLPMQRNDLEQYCKLILNTTNFEIFEDAGYSAKNTDRPAFQNMMERIRQKEFTHVLVWKIDRISRNLSDFANMWEEFEKYDVQFISKIEQFDTSTAMGRAIVSIIMVFAQLEREMTAMRVTSTMISRAEQGKWNGSRPCFGYIFDQDKMFPVPDEDESKILQMIFNKYEEIRSTNKVAKFLNSNGYKTKRNGLWSSKTINQILSNPFYIGTLRYNYKKSGRGKIKPENEWVIIENNHDAIIDKEQWYRVQDILKHNATHQFRQITQKYTHIFSGLLECQKCGGGLSSYKDRERANGYRPSVYSCSNMGHGRNCDMNSYISDMVIGEFVLNYMSNMLTIQKTGSDNLESDLLRGKVFKDVAYITEDSLESLSHILRGENELNKLSGSKIEEIDNSALIQRKAKLERALQRLENLYLFSDTDMSEKDYLNKRAPILNELNSIKIQNTKKHTPLLVDNKQLDKCVIDWKLGSGDYINYKKLVLDLDEKVLKDFFNMVIERIVVGDKRRIYEIRFKNGLSQKFLYR